jgi:hypothetical protein
MTADMRTARQFAEDNRVRLACEWADANPHMDGSDRMDNWRCKLRCGRRAMTVYFSKGFGHNGKEPDVAEVLDCLASDAASVENAGSFEDWCGEYGYDTDSRKAEATYRLIEKQAAKLKALLGADEYKLLLFHTERE